MHDETRRKWRLENSSNRNGQIDETKLRWTFYLDEFVYKGPDRGQSGDNDYEDIYTFKTEDGLTLADIEKSDEWSDFSQWTVRIIFYVK